MKKNSPAGCGCCEGSCENLYMQTATGVPLYGGDTTGGNNWNVINAGNVWTAKAFDPSYYEDHVWLGWGSATGTAMSVHDDTIPSGDVVQLTFPNMSFPPLGTSEFSASDVVTIGDILFFADPTTGSGWHVRLTWDIIAISGTFPYDPNNVNFTVTVTDPSGTSDTITHKLFSLTVGLKNTLFALSIEIRGDNVSIWISDGRDVKLYAGETVGKSRRYYCVWAEDIVSGDRPGSSWGLKQVSGVTYYVGEAFPRALFKVASSSAIESQTVVDGGNTSTFPLDDFCDNCSAAFDQIGPSPLTGRVEIAISGYPTSSYVDPAGYTYNLISADPNGTVTYGPDATGSSDIPCGAPSIYQTFEWERSHPSTPTTFLNFKSSFNHHSQFKDSSGNALSVIDRWTWQQSNNTGTTGPFASCPVNLDQIAHTQPDDWDFLTSPRRFYHPPQTTGILNPIDKATITIKGVV